VGIISALNHIPGNFEIRLDREDIVKLLTGKAKIRNKTIGFVEKIHKLRKNREINFVHEPRETNKAGLKNDGLSLIEINNPKLLANRLALKRESKNKMRRNLRKKKEVIWLHLDLRLVYSVYYLIYFKKRGIFAGK